MSRLTRDGTAKFVARDQILGRERGRQGNNNFPCLADYQQDWQPYLVDALAVCGTIHTTCITWYSFFVAFALLPSSLFRHAICQVDSREGVIPDCEVTIPDCEVTIS